ncbi:hypothetical protein CCYA_CCYA12G3294 [Cyanidiococcus yangmingshanensis]|nr:hypothetical protein CCYA_CCYA12G3294 [Cyanidiococcus yangmingshanensis]
MDEDNEPSVLLGFVLDSVYEKDQPQSKVFTPFESRAGGSPAWLVPVRSPPPEPPHCLSCQRLLSFLLQVYAPRERNPAAFHRVLYVFVCAWCVGRTPTPAGAVRVYRVQLAQENPWYPLQVNDLDSLRRDYASAHSIDMMKVALAPASKTAASEATANSIEELTTSNALRLALKPEQVRRDASLLNETKQGESSSSFRGCMAAFPTMEIVVDVEEGSDLERNSVQSDGAAVDGESVERLESRPLLGVKETALEGHAANAASEWVSLIESVERDQRACLPHLMDTFAFEQALGSRRDQVLRYLPLWDTVQAGMSKDLKRLAESLDQYIVWYGLRHRLASALVPPCPYCGGPRFFEFQVMPQLIYYLCRESETADVESNSAESLVVSAARDDDPRLVLDFGTIVVWTCPRDCLAPEADVTQTVTGSPFHPYLEEFAYAQPALNET